MSNLAIAAPRSRFAHTTSHILQSCLSGSISGGRVKPSSTSVAQFSTSCGSFQYHEQGRIETATPRHLSIINSINTFPTTTQRRYTSHSTRSNYETLHVPRRVHILGSGSIGKFVAHSLRSIPNPPPVTLLLHRPSYLDEFRSANRSITLIRDDQKHIRTGIDAELALPRRERGRQRQGHATPTNRERFSAEEGSDIIHNLIVTTKAPTTVSAIDAIKHRLLPTSTILFLQNGMGIMEEVNRTLFPDEATRPNYMLGINSHGVHTNAPFTITHAGQGVISLGLVPRNQPNPSMLPIESPNWATSSRYLLRTLTRTPILAAVGISPTDLLQAQLEKLAVNCLINPLTVLLDSQNGSLLYNFSLQRVRYLLLAEISAVIQRLPELRGIPNISRRFSPERLEAMTVRVASATSGNVSSMLADVRRGIKTEVEYINGWVVRRGEEVGVKCVMNYMLMHLVIGKHQMISREIDEYVPFGSEEVGAVKRVKVEDEEDGEDVPIVMD